jgi:hypothetical protein
MNTNPLDGAVIDGVIRYATAPIPAGQISSVLIMAERNIQTIVGGMTFVHTVAGQIAAQVQITVDTPSIAMAHTVNGDGIFNNTFMIGHVVSSLDLTGSMYMTGYLSFRDTFVHEIAGDVQMEGMLSGANSFTLVMAGDPIAVGLMSGDMVDTLTMTGDLSVNISSPDDDARTFKREFTQREFRR